MTAEIDDSFKKPGAVPFKWEIRPGVPKLHHQHRQQQHSSPLQAKKHLSPPTLLSPSPPSFISRSRHPSPTTQFLRPPSDVQSRSFRSTPRRAHSERWRTTEQVRRQPEVVAPAGCFINLPSLPKLLLRKKSSKNKKKKKTCCSSSSVPEMDRDGYGSDGLETFSRWSVSSRRSLSPFMDSPASPYSYSSSSYDQLSPRPPMGDAEWAGFGLF
ncbi:hypothetical protein LINPERHAP1_LOCUS10610 [Linum perenne]